MVRDIPLKPLAARLLRQGPAAFQRQCRAESKKHFLGYRQPNSAIVRAEYCQRNDIRSPTPGRHLVDNENCPTIHGSPARHPIAALLGGRDLPKQTKRIWRGQRDQVRGFANSARRGSSAATSETDNVPDSGNTIILQNPQLDDNGEEMRVRISPRAAKRLEHIISTPTPKHTSPKSVKMQAGSTPQANEEVDQTSKYHHLRISVTSGGCHGFQYLMSLEPASGIDKDVDTVFAYDLAPQLKATDEGEGHEQAVSNLSASQPIPPSTPPPSSSLPFPSSPVSPSQSHSQPLPSIRPLAKVVLDDSSLSLLKGSTVDFSSELIGSQFVITGNPRAKSSCGCGTSFDVVD